MRRKAVEEQVMSTLVRAVLLLAAVLAVPHPSLAQTIDGGALYARNCASCHDAAVNRAPDRETFRAMTPARVLASMETGSMITMANNRTAAERRAIAEYLTGRSLSTPLVTTPRPEAMCTTPAATFSASTGPQWSGWGQDASNARYQSAPGLTAADVPRLKLKWAFGFPGDLQSYAQATLAGGRVFVGSVGGKVYALDASSGCVHWYYQAGEGVRSAVSAGTVRMNGTPRDLAFFGDGLANVYALDAGTGALVWKVDVEEFPVGRVSGSPVLHEGRLYVPLASGEEGAGASPSYECCRFRGSIVALDAPTGKRLWKTYLIPEEPKPTKKNAVGTQLWGPSGVPVWSSPTIDPVRRALYITTGNNYSDPTTSMSDAFVALDLESGRVLWSVQMTPNDAYTAACRLPDKTNCAESNGPDVDFGASPMLVTLRNGRRVLVAGQKNGIVHAIDPDDRGRILWQTRIGQGGTMGGIQWGSATDGTVVYAGLSDIGRIMLTYSNSTDADPKRGGGMFALRLEDGVILWSTPPPGCGDRRRCSPAQSQAVSAIPGIAFSGSVDGRMRAYSATDGRIVWEVDTIRGYETVNGVEARGGSLDGPGPAIGGGIVYVNSGYPTAGGMPGNVLLAFSVDGQ